MCETESVCAENIGLKDIARSRRVELISRGYFTAGIIYACTKF